MSFQRVIETARRTGVPVIMTDVAGREPMVILSLEQFEAMAGDGAREPVVRRSQAPAGRPVQKDVDAALADIAEEQTHVRTDRSADAVKQEVAADDLAGLAIEERFYLEPVEDKQ